jgi:hypothetical protein
MDLQMKFPTNSECYTIEIIKKLNKIIEHFL